MYGPSARAVLFCVAALTLLAAFGAGAASAYEATMAGWYWQNPLVQGNSLHDVAVVGDRAVAVGDAGSVFTSDDGSSWVKRSAGNRGNRLQSVVFVNASTGWAAGKGGVIKTTDGGVTWTSQNVPGAGAYTFSSISFVDASRGWACGSYAVDGSVTACRVVRTEDGGAHWTLAEQWTSSGALKAPAQLLLQVDFVNDTVGWATGWGFDAAAADWGYVVLKTMDAGESWTFARFGAGSAAITAMDFTSDTVGWLATGSLDHYVPATVWKTTDGGATWVPRLTKDGATISDLAASPGGECYATGQMQGMSDWTGFIVHTADGGASWSEEFSGESLKPEGVAFSSSSAIAVGAGALTLKRSATTGTWTQNAQGVRKNLTNVRFWDTKLGWAVGWKSTILRTTDGGRKWAETSVPRGVSLEAIDMVTKKVGWAVGCSGPHVPYADMDAGYGAVVLRTTDGGRHWKFQVDRSTKPGLAGVDFSDTKHGVAVGTSGITARTQDGGKTWWFRTIGSGTLRDVKFTDKDNGVAVGGDTGTRSGSGSVWKTSDGGVKWTAATTSVAPTAPLRAISTAPDKSLFVVGDRSQIYTSASVDSWTFTDMTPGIVVQDPPYGHSMDGGLCDIGTSTVLAPDDARGWILGDDGAVWTNDGSRWTLPPTISSFTPDSGATGTAVTLFGSGFKPSNPGDTGAIGWIKVTDGGSGYTTAPVVTVDPPEAGTRATAIATIDADGVVTGIAVEDGGFGYFADSIYGVSIENPPIPGRRATALAVTLASTVVEFPGGTLAVPTNVTDTQLTVDVPEDEVTGRVKVVTLRGNGTSSQRFVVPGSEPVIQTHLSNHSGGSGQDNQLNGLAVVDWLNAWAVGERGTILSFDRLSPQTTITPSDGWVKTPQLSLAASDGKSGVSWVRWVVDPPGVDGDEHPPIGNWDDWPWTYGTTVTFPGRHEGDAPGARHIVYYQAMDYTGNVELDPFWLGLAEGADDPWYEVPKHMWVTLDDVGPQTYAPWPVTVKRNSKPAFDFWVNDDLSDKAKVTIVVKKTSGATVKTFSLGWLPTWHEFSSPISDWKCSLAKGSYTFEVLAEDQAGNTQAVKGTNTFTVR